MNKSTLEENMNATKQKIEKHSQLTLDKNEAKVGNKLLDIHKKVSSVNNANIAGAHQTPKISNTTINKKGNLHALPMC